MLKGRFDKSVRIVNQRTVNAPIWSSSFCVRYAVLGKPLFGGLNIILLNLGMRTDLKLLDNGVCLGAV